jgi:hypothetical protein
MNDKSKSGCHAAGQPSQPAILSRLKACFAAAFPAAVKTGSWLLLITVPLSFAVLLLQVTGVLDLLGVAFKPVFGVLGLPPEAALVYATSCLLNIYSCIAVIETLGLTGRAVTILALMCLIAHNLPVESAVQQKANSKAWKMVVLRLAVSLAAGLALSLLLPADEVQAAPTQHAAAAASSLGHAFGQWGIAVSKLCAKIMVLITLLMILERILAEFGVSRLLSRLLKYPLMLLGLPPSTAFLWVVANTLGLAYGAGVIVDNVKRGELPRKDADLLNHHIGVCHSLLEDTCLFVAIGVPVLWITVPRILMAAAVVWIKRLFNAATGDAVRA